MARLRFPGRPGCRFDRFGVHYNSDEHYNGSDATTQIVSNIHRGLRVFRELFGESDEVISRILIIPIGISNSNSLLKEFS